MKESIYLFYLWAVWIIVCLWTKNINRLVKSFGTNLTACPINAIFVDPVARVFQIRAEFSVTSFLTSLHSVASIVSFTSCNEFISAPWNTVWSRTTSLSENCEKRLIVTSAPSCHSWPASIFNSVNQLISWHIVIV